MPAKPEAKKIRRTKNRPGGLETRRIHGQPSWVISSGSVEAAVTHLGGHLAPVHFRIGGKDVQPFSIAPWAEEEIPAEVPDLLRALRGDFFCAPFGGNEKPYRGETHPPHGETANRAWTPESFRREGGRHILHLSMETGVRKGRVDKWIELREGETAVYSSHVLSGMTGPMNLGHHATLKFPDREGAGLISTSQIRHAQVAPEPFEVPAARGYQSLRSGETFTRLDRVPSALGGHADLSSYPARDGYEDLVMVAHRSRADFAWTAVTFPDEGHVWFALKDPRVLTATIFWHSNGGRHYPPWNGRHRSVLGLEDVTSYFHYGLAESARENPWSRQGIATSVSLSKKVPLDVRTIMGVAALPKGFRRVKSITPHGDHVTITSTKGLRFDVPIDTDFLQNPTP